MTQVELALPPAAAPQRDDPVGFKIGWDHAHHGLVPPPELLLDGTPIGQGWRAARAALRGRSWPAHRCTRQWLALRIEAWRLGAAFDLQTVTPNHLAQIEVRQCPVLRTPLGGSGAAPGAAHIARLNPQAAYAAGNLLMLSQAADHAWQGLSVIELVRCARAAELNERLSAAIAAGEPTDARASHWADIRAIVAAGIPAGLAATIAAGIAAPAPSSASSNLPPNEPSSRASSNATAASAETPAALDAAAWWRLATLRSLATPLHMAEAARLPLAVTPPNRVRVLNAVQALQALLTARLTAADWTARMAAVAARLPAHGLRTDFNLWVGALAPRVLEAQARGRPTALALEDAWLAERVQRRWHHFAIALGAPGCEHLVAQLAGRQPGGHTGLARLDDQTTDGWALPAAAGPEPAPGHFGAPFSPAGGRAAAAAPAPRPGRRRTAPTPFAPPSRATTAPRRAAT